MPRMVWTYARAPLPEGAEAPVESPPDVVGDGRAMLRIRSASGQAAGPPAGARRYPARWQAWGSSGGATLTVVPLTGWAYEIHLAIEAPRSLFRRLTWPRNRLDRIAAGLTSALRFAAEDAAARSAARPPRTIRRAPATARWLSVSSSPSR